MDFSTIFKYIYHHLDFFISIGFSVVFLVVNIIQAVRSKDLDKLKKVIKDLPNIIRKAEQLGTNYFSEVPEALSTTTAAFKSLYKKAMAESLLISTYGEKFVKKHYGVLSDSIEDILDTPAKKGGSYELSKKDEER